MSPWIGVAALAVVVAWNAFFVAAEYAFVASRPSRLAELVAGGSRRAERVLDLQRDPTRFISSVQVAITMSSLAAGAVGEPAVRRLLETAMEPLGEVSTRVVSTVVATVLAFAIVTAITVVLGEIVPKTLSLVRSEQVALMTVGPVRAFSAIFRPFIALLEWLSRLASRLLGLPPPTTAGRAHSEEELKLLFAESEETGVLDAEERAMLSRVFEFGDTEVRDVMVPRPDVVTLGASATVEDACDVALASAHARFPVLDEDDDGLRGVLSVRRLLALVRAGGAQKAAEAADEAMVVPETRRLDDLLADFRRARRHFAVVVDEYGSLAGVVTLTDLTEEIVGEVAEGAGERRSMIVPLAPDRVLVPGAFAIDDFDERFGTSLATPEVRSLGGLVFTTLGRVPAIGDSVALPGVHLIVRRMDGPRITSLEARLEAGLT